MTHLIFVAITFVGFVGILYTIYELAKLNDYFYEVYEYDRDPYT